MAVTSWKDGIWGTGKGENKVNGLFRTKRIRFEKIQDLKSLLLFYLWHFIITSFYR